ncbi:uncharacterized protein DUF1396 [Mumia flava]|uniref:Uncharacterized protein DUF1396 n=1 Tax=Mumia flava TaxID=1348852 RepID=A0A0B2BHZ8_9ACTN|nr:DUF6612 family protein [Mumia flava]PJJ58287.1 uncharacterized protein DUF1396 [Mumia flava]
MRIRSLSAALAATALVLTAGCSNSSDVAGGDDPAPAAASADGAGSDGDALTPASFASTVAAAQSDATSAHVEMSMEIGGQSIEGTGDVAIAEDPDDVEMAMSMAAAGQDIDLIFTGGLVYLRLPAMTGEKWIKADPDDPTAQQLTGSFGQMKEQMDPSKGLEMLEGAITDVENTGETEQLDGVEAVRYDVTVDTAKLGDGSLGAGLPKEIVYSYWLGPDDLPRKVLFELTGAQAEMTYSDWGEPVDVEVPAKKDTMKLDQVPGLGALGG